MRIKEYIQNKILLPRLKRTGIITVYDEHRRYHELCLELENDNLCVIDASLSSITSREAAMRALIELGHQESKVENMLIYIPAKPPLSDEEKQRDPFAIYTVCGEVFPDGDGDEFIHICLKAKPDFATDIRRIFSENPNPPFEVIDAISLGNNWPTLQALLRVESSRDILLSLLVPTNSQKKALVDSDTWIMEAKQLLLTCLGMKLMTQLKNWQFISEEMWRFILFSEFSFSIKEKMPESLLNVPRASESARILVEDICEQIRNDQRTQAIYIENAESVEKELNLAEHCKSIKFLGDRDTFPFEESFFLERAIVAFNAENTDIVRSIIKKHANSVWSGKGESQAKWQLIQAALNLWEACNDNERELTENIQSQGSLLDFYINSLREVDRLQREFENTVSDYYMDFSDKIEELIKSTRGRYSRLTNRVQQVFIRHLEKQGWPPQNRLANINVFETYVSPKLVESGNKVAYFQVDSLRYELGVELAKQLNEEGQVEVQAAYAQLPSITSVGMASLLPEAGSMLSIERNEDGIQSVYDSVCLTSVSQRMDVIRKKYGQRFEEITLSDLIRGNKKVSPTVDLLVVRSIEIDQHLEANPENTLGIIQDTLKRIRFSLNKLKKLGFHDVIIATDHGFYLNMQHEAGSVCTKPDGNWVNKHNRIVLGHVKEDNANYVIAADFLGIRGNIQQVGGPRSLVSYRAGESYLHGGASLQECVIPIISIKLLEEKQQIKKPDIKLSYKNGAKYITTRLPVIDLTWEDKQIELFDMDPDIEILIEAYDNKGQIIGEAKTGGLVNPATGTVFIKKAQRIQVTLRMQIDFEGKFVVKAMNPKTMATYCYLELETDYVG
nr:PglZ domain-containing protein [Neobacillus sp. Marseille-Q6967]